MRPTIISHGCHDRSPAQMVQRKKQGPQGCKIELESRRSETLAYTSKFGLDPAVGCNIFIGCKCRPCAHFGVSSGQAVVPEAEQTYLTSIPSLPQTLLLHISRAFAWRPRRISRGGVKNQDNCSALLPSAETPGCPSRPYECFHTNHQIIVTRGAG